MFNRSKLSAEARRYVRKAPPDQIVKGLVEVRPTEDLTGFRLRVEGYGVTIRSWPHAARTVAVEMPVRSLEALGNDDDVIYVEVGRRMYAV